MPSLDIFLRTFLQHGYIPYQAYLAAMKRFSCTFREVETAVFQAGWLPLRYQRNQQSLSQEEQTVLFNAHILILGCGGLGGNVAELLTRIGVGTLTLVDGDVYEEHNLNRQNFSTPATLGKPKATVVANALQAINPALHVIPETCYFDTTTRHLVDNKNVVVDALDDPQIKHFLALTCKEQKIPFVHGAIAGWVTQCTTSTSLEKLYKQAGKGAEATTGNLPFTASLAASIQAALVIKLLLNKESLDETLWMIDLLDNESIQLPL